MKNAGNTFERSFSPGIRAALSLVLDDLDSKAGELSLDFFQIVREIYFDLRDASVISSDNRYQRLRQTMQRLPDKVRPLYGNYPESELQRWRAEQDRALIARMKVRWPEHHRFRRFIGELLCSALDGSHRVVKGEMTLL